jgi:hypothetical protein
MEAVKIFKNYILTVFSKSATMLMISVKVIPSRLVPSHLMKDYVFAHEEKLTIVYSLRRS